MTSEKELARRLKQAERERDTYLQHLEIISSKSEIFNQQRNWKSFFSVLFDTFRELFPGSEILVSDLFREKLFPSGYTGLFTNRRIRDQCLRSPAERLGDPRDCHEKNWTANPRFSRLFPKSLQQYPCYLEFYLNSRSRQLGVIQVFTTSARCRNYRRQAMMFNILKNLAGAALEKILFYQKSKSGNRIKDELEIARGIQRHFTPADPLIPGYTIKGHIRPAHRVGGDYLDYFQNRFGDWILVIADVSGKGIPAAIFMTSLRSVFRNEGQGLRSPRDLLCRVNEVITPDLLYNSTFITCICIILPAHENVMIYSHAGHPMFVQFRAGRGAPRDTSLDGVALGLMEGTEFRANIGEERVKVRKGDKFLAYSDGLVETMASGNRLFGQERLLELLAEHRKRSPGELIDIIRSHLDEFSGGLHQQDDTTMIALEKI